MDQDSLLEPKVEGDRYTIHNNDIHDPRYRNFVRPLVNLIALRQSISCEGLDFGAGPGPVISHMLGKCKYGNKVRKCTHYSMKPNENKTLESAKEWDKK